MSINIEWQLMEPETWRANYEGYRLHVYRNLKTREVFFKVSALGGVELTHQQVKGILPTAKKAAANWLAGYLGEKVALEEEQQTALNLAAELERLQAMEARLKEYIAKLEYNCDPDVYIVREVVYGGEGL